MTPEEERILAWTLLGEADNQGQRGMEAVAFVIRNRTASGRFPQNPATVALQPGQFSTWNPISQGGNIPRARFPVESAPFNNALRAVRKVFGPTPGSDPTQGATHYYAPSGMPGGAAPYWWRGESSHAGDVRIGGHIFAAKYEPKKAPIPATRRGTDSVGYYPDKYTMQVMATGKPIRLPEIPPPRETLEEQLRRENAGQTPKETVVMRYDPLQKQVVRVGTTSSAQRNIAAQRAEQQAANREKVTRVAGFSVPGGTSGIAVVDAERKLQANAKTEERLNDLRANQSNVERGVPRVQTKFAQPKGSLVPKTEERLAPQGALVPKVSASDLARGKTGAVPPPRPRPVHVPVYVPPVQQVPVPAARRVLKIMVEGAKTVTPATVLARSPVDELRAQGLSPSDAYAQANVNAAQRARENASNPAHVSSNSYFNEVTGR